MIDLSNVTLLTIDGVGDDINAVKALKYSTKHINFAKIKYITAGDNRPGFCETYKIPKLSYDDYNKFCLTGLQNYVDTDYVLLIQSDGFVVNPNLWSNEFFKYDYIGAPWDPNFAERNLKDKKIFYDPFMESNMTYNIGNGGFSLRSKKLLKYVADLYSKKYKEYAEDAVISIGMRKELENYKIKFPEHYKIAIKFSCECRIINNEIFSSDNSFGFHCDETHRDKFKLLETVTL